MITTASQTLGIAKIQLTTLSTRLVRRLLRAIFVTETPRDVVLIALDIVGFGKRDSAGQARLRRRLFTAVKVIKQDLGNLISYDVLDRGDGVLLLLPGTTDTMQILEAAVPGLANRVDTDNRVSNDNAMALKCAIHKGRALRDRWGWVGQDVNLVFRLLDSRTLKKALHDGPRSPVTVALSEVLYRDACAQIADEDLLLRSIEKLWHDKLTSHRFRAKETDQIAWVATASADR